MNCMDILIYAVSGDDYFSITFRTDDSIWICRKDGEGMQIKNIDLFNIINKFFTENH